MGRGDRYTSRDRRRSREYRNRERSRSRNDSNPRRGGVRFDSPPKVTECVVYTFSNGVATDNKMHVSVSHAPSLFADTASMSTKVNSTLKLVSTTSINGFLPGSEEVSIPVDCQSSRSVLYIGNLPPRVSAQQVKTFVNKAGRVIGIGKHRREGIVEKVEMPRIGFGRGNMGRRRSLVVCFVHLHC